MLVHFMMIKEIELDVLICVVFALQTTCKEILAISVKGSPELGRSQTPPRNLNATKTASRV